jgi:hypothetical protein
VAVRKLSDMPAQLVAISVSVRRPQVEDSTATTELLSGMNRNFSNMVRRLYGLIRVEMESFRLFL